MVPDREEELLKIVEELANELRRERVPVALDSSLEGDLGFDSLTRMELLLRIERAFSSSLPDLALTTALTPRDLLRLLRAGAEPLADEAPDASRGPALEEVEAPVRAATLVAALDWHADAHPDRLHVRLYGEGGREEAVTYAALRDGARNAAAALQERGLERGERVALMLPTGTDYLFAFLGAIIAGGVPVPMYPPTRPGQLEEHLRRHAGILANSEAAFLVAAPQARAACARLSRRAPALRGFLAPEDLRSSGAPRDAGPRPDDIAFLQYTSGSTGSPKGVILTHRNVLANVRAMGRATAASSRDVFVSWLPLYHDMGLIGAWLSALYFGAPLVLLSPLAFLARPHRWLRAIHRHRGTISAAPNFAYELCVAGIDARRLEGLDLSCWRLAVCAAEPVSAAALEGFRDKFAAFGLRPEALAPTFGLAESTVGLAFTPLGRGPRIDRVRRGPFAELGRALPAGPDEAGALQFVSCGRALPGHELRIVDESGFEAGERQEGRLWFKGPSACGGYFRNPEATRKLFHGDWLDTGDLAYLAGDELFVTGRVKEMLIRGGRHAYPYELEEAAGALPGIRKGGVAAFGCRDPRTGGERLVVMAETRASEPAERERLRRRVNELACDLLGMPADDVMLVEPHTVLKTSSGKIRRAACRELYEAGGPRAERSWRRRARRRLEA
ncbi:MAG: AMP-binding protein, partial [Elusimicrobiota bacterium]|nr:AMP-binding protein [Elusimicrobiota bacterium]